MVGAFLSSVLASEWRKWSCSHVLPLSCVRGSNSVSSTLLRPPLVLVRRSDLPASLTPGSFPSSTVWRFMVVLRLPRAVTETSTSPVTSSSLCVTVVSSQRPSSPSLAVRSLYSPPPPLGRSPPVGLFLSPVLASEWRKWSFSHVLPLSCVRGSNVVSSRLLSPPLVFVRRSDFPASLTPGSVPSLPVCWVTTVLRLPRAVTDTSTPPGTSRSECSTSLTSQRPSSPSRCTRSRYFPPPAGATWSGAFADCVLADASVWRNASSEHSPATSPALGTVVSLVTLNLPPGVTSNSVVSPTAAASAGLDGELADTVRTVLPRAVTRTVRLDSATGSS